MVEAAVKTLRFHLARMLEHEAGTRLGEDPEELHVMRVSTRRMRMALRVFDDYLDRQAHAARAQGPAPHGPHARRGARPRRLPGEDAALPGHFAAGARRRARRPARRLRAPSANASASSLVDYLDGGRYRAFVEHFEELLDGPLDRLSARPPADPRPQRVSQVLPGVLYQDMAVVWAFEGQLGGLETPLPRFHALRKGCKGLRYTLEFFEDVLGPGARPLIKKVKGLQDHLGDLQDAVVTAASCATTSPGARGGTAATTSPAPSRSSWRPGRRATWPRARRRWSGSILTFPDVWPTIAGSGFSRELATVIAEI